MTLSTGIHNTTSPKNVYASDNSDGGDIELDSSWLLGQTYLVFCKFK